MSQQKVLANKSEDLSSIPWTYMVGEPAHASSYDLQVHTMEHTPTHAHKINKNN